MVSAAFINCFKQSPGLEFIGYELNAIRLGNDLLQTRVIDFSSVFQMIQQQKFKSLHVALHLLSGNLQYFDV